MTKALEMIGIYKRFPGVVANDGIDFSLEQGEIHALLGENGAGKTTLMNILYGLYQPDAGEIFIKGARQEIHSPSDAIRAGIGMVHQHFMLVPTLTVAENVILGRELSNGPFLDMKGAIHEIKKVSKKYGLSINPEHRVWQLSVGIQQRVEILKALYRGAEILILDEPTSVLTPVETEQLFANLKSMADQGKSVIFISHKLKEVKEISSKITVLRGGKKVGTAKTEETTERELAQMMVGRDVVLTVSKQNSTDIEREIIASIRHLQVQGNYGLMAVKDFSVDIHKGEILGVAGVDGNGQAELAEALAGLRKAEGGEVIILGKNVNYASPFERTSQGMGYVPADRKARGSVLSLPILDNIILKHHRISPYSSYGILSDRTIRELSKRLVEEYDIRCPSIDVVAEKLSGGNLQKLVLARETFSIPQFLIAEYPTRGLDVGATDYVRALLLDLRKKGTAILLISADLDEILELSDRIVVMYEGQIMGEFLSHELNIDEIGLAMAGLSQSGTQDI
jgi:simple sugar transport system ATP-binding protein